MKVNSFFWAAVAERGASWCLKHERADTRERESGLAWLKIILVQKMRCFYHFNPYCFHQLPRPIQTRLQTRHPNPIQGCLQRELASTAGPASWHQREGRRAGSTWAHLFSSLLTHQCFTHCEVREKMSGEEGVVESAVVKFWRSPKLLEKFLDFLDGG